MYILDQWFSKSKNRLLPLTKGVLTIYWGSKEIKELGQTTFPKPSGSCQFFDENH
jgi:hypothetical protein